MANLAGIIQQVQRERANVAKELERLDAVLSALNGTTAGRPGARRLSAAARAKIAAAQRARWAKVRANGGRPSKVVKMSRRRTLSAAARKRIAAAQRARWAKFKAQQKKSA